ncbi:MAG: hypothetical protein V1873_00065 [Verrucomicrobiota bacterium]
MRKVLTVLLVLLVLAVIVIGLVFFFTSGMVGAADGFFRAVAQKDIAKTRPFLAEGFLADTSIQELDVFLKQTALADYHKAHWGDRSISAKGVGELEGSVETRTGGMVPIKIYFVKEKGEWKILNIQKTKAGIDSAKGAEETPPDDQLKKMVGDSIHSLGTAINGQDFGEFYGKVARLWQAQTTKEDLLKAFQAFVDQKIDLAVLERLEPVFSEVPKIDDEGMLLVQGYYPSQPVVYFKTTYVYEHPQWLLGGINVQVK